MIKKKAIAIITARGGSKRLPRKNIKEFCGYPIIKYSIDAALNAGCFDEVMVSTEDEEIAAISRSFGAKIPFYRSEFTAGDTAMNADVVDEVLAEYKKMGEEYQYFCCFLPTAPFVTAERIRLGFELIEKHSADTVLPVTKYDSPIEWAMTIENDRLIKVYPEDFNHTSNKLIPKYHDVGQFYWINTDYFLARSAGRPKRFFGDNIIPIEIPFAEAQDIDNQEDWETAELKYRLLKEKTNV